MNEAQDAGQPVEVRFIAPDGTITLARGAVGDTLLSAGQAAGVPLEGTCEGAMACSTCHVIVAPDWFARLPRASDEEEDMLDLAAGIDVTSRLSCQIVLTPELSGLEARVPAESRDMRRAL